MICIEVKGKCEDLDLGPRCRKTFSVGLCLDLAALDRRKSVRYAGNQNISEHITHERKLPGVRDP